MSESTKIVSADGTIEYRNASGLLHREDGPAYIYASGTQVWYVNGIRHREDGPAMIEPDGSQTWYKNDLIHREDGPAEISKDFKLWFKSGLRHREDGPAYVGAFGEQIWYLNDLIHRDDGPAYLGPNGTQEWCQNGRSHREDGPAIIHADGRQDWNLIGLCVSKNLVDSLDSLTAEIIHNAKVEKGVFEDLEDRRFPNAELRAWLINRMGWAKYLREINAQPVDSRSNDIENTKEALYKVKGILGKQLVVTCPTGRVFSLHVPDRIKTCEQAQRWLGNDTKKKFNVIGRT